MGLFFQASVWQRMLWGHWTLDDNVTLCWPLTNRVTEWLSSRRIRRREKLFQALKGCGTAMTALKQVHPSWAANTGKDSCWVDTSLPLYAFVYFAFSVFYLVHHKSSIWYILGFSLLLILLGWAQWCVTIHWSRPLRAFVWFYARKAALIDMSRIQEVDQPIM